MSRDKKFLTDMAAQIRRDVVEMVYKKQSGHIGGALSIAEALAALYFDILRVDPENPRDPGRDRFVLSKGHVAPGLYAVLAEAGFYPRETLFTSFRGVDCSLQGHPDMKKTPGVDFTSGSLGIGLSAAVGMALGGRHQNLPFRVYCMIGDGEIDEGQIWEAAGSARHFGLDTLTAFVDANGLQNDAATKKVKDKLDIANKWRAFGWHAEEINGHDFDQIFAAVDEAVRTKGVPSVIVLNTVKGKGVDFMENVVEWHGKSPNKEQYERAMQQLG